MPPTLALAGCLALIGVLLAIDRARNRSVSAALWIPTCWMLISASKPVGRWLGSESLVAVEGSPWDRLVLTVLICLALVVCAKRKVEWGRVLRGNLWVILLFAYMGLSALWVEYPFVSLKRWIKSAGPILMALVVLTERAPFEAFGTILRRCAYILIPLSLVLIKYYPALGRAYHHWTGIQMWTGVTTHKNTLGQLCAVSAFFLVWSLLRRGRGGEERRTSPHVAADVMVLGLAVFLLVGPGDGGYSATAIAITGAASAAFIALNGRDRIAGAVAAHARLLTVVLAVAYLLLAKPLTSLVTSLLGRNQDLTGRATEIWPMVLDAAARHPFLGAGYGGAWGVGGELTSLVGVEQAHNGYLDIYLELGVVGLVLMTGVIFSYGAKIRSQAAGQLDWAIFSFCILLMTLLQNLSETAFFDVYLATVMLTLCIVLSASLASPPLIAATIAVPAAHDQRFNGSTTRTTMRNTNDHPHGGEQGSRLAPRNGTQVPAGRTLGHVEARHGQARTRHAWPGRATAGGE